MHKAIVPSMTRCNVASLYQSRCAFNMYRRKGRYGSLGNATGLILEGGDQSSWVFRNYMGSGRGYMSPHWPEFQNPCSEAWT